MITLTRELAYAAATDEGNRSMRRANRRAWNLTDYNIACREFNRLWSIEQDPAAVPFCTFDAPGSERIR